MRKIGVALICALMVVMGACSNEYTRDTGTGHYKEISFATLQEKVKSGDTFLALISQTDCSHCQDFKSKVLKPYLKDHGMNVYEVNLTNEENPKETFTSLQNYISKLNKGAEDMEFKGTPYTMVVKDKKQEVGRSGIMTKSDFDEIVVKYQLDEKKAKSAK